ncbi:DUF6899 family protein [Marinobacter denitrificans]|uniref:DUF6899 family protein n=1 Tax=Marinobacter TaxID=2742 RepID=UPI00384B6319
MPYINTIDRPRLDEGAVPRTAGELNYAITKLVDAYLLEVGLNYAHLNDAIGVLECAKLELYRRIAAPYEDQKISTNGDVYSIDK